MWVGAALVLLGACGGKAGNVEEASDGAATGAESASEPTGGTGSATAAMCEEQSAALLRGFGRRRPGIDFAGTTGDETDGSSGDGTGDGTTGAEHQLCPDHTAVDACCCCFSDVPNGIGPNVVCDVVGLCPTIVLRKDAGLVLLSCPETVDCALAALIAGKPGAIGWTLITGGEGGKDATDLFIAGDGTAFEWSYSEYDLGCSIDPVRHWMLESKDYFIGCTEKTAVLDRFECLTGAFGEVLEECIGGADCGPGI